MSTTGFVHTLPGQPSEFISRSDWTRESSLFHVISNITFFKNYLLLKSFLIWRTHVRFKLYCQLRRRLAKNFFLARETFCSPLLAVQDSITDIQDVSLMSLERGGKAFKHNAFSQAQKNVQETAASTLESFVAKSYAVVKKVSTSSTLTCRPLTSSLQVTFQRPFPVLSPSRSSSGMRDRVPQREGVRRQPRHEQQR